MNIPPELSDTLATKAALVALQKQDVQKCGDLIIKWQNDLRIFESKKQDMETVLHLGEQLKNELTRQGGNQKCLNVLNELLDDIREALNED